MLDPYEKELIQEMKLKNIKQKRTKTSPQRSLNDTYIAKGSQVSKPKQYKLDVNQLKDKLFKRKTG